MGCRRPRIPKTGHNSGKMIVDTNALSALSYDDPALLARMDHPNTPRPYLNFICLGEYRSGILGSTRPQKPLAMLEQICAAWPTLHSDNITVTHYAEISDKLRTKGRSIPTNDIWIAALARQHDMPILSQDRHFDHIPGIERIGW
ncbi:MAG: type II toxin-antitoxin system VapC family toxin [Puniceicoccaceae bacterium]|nr:MAG: type II toxin-antitoxin system VapC family toxin [Puniceicoccaceae bacterium]